MSFSMPMLTPNNYTVWAINAEAILDAQSLSLAVSPASEAAVNDKKNKAASAMLFGAFSEDILTQVSMKKTVAQVWTSLKTRFVKAERVRAAWMSTFHGKFEWLHMTDGDTLDVFVGKIGYMAAHYTVLGSTLDDLTMVKKLLELVPDFLYSVVAGMEQLCEVEKMSFEEALSRLKAFYKTMCRGAQAGGERDMSS